MQEDRIPCSCRCQVASYALYSRLLWVIQHLPSSHTSLGLTLSMAASTTGTAETGRTSIQTTLICYILIVLHLMSLSANVFLEYPPCLVSSVCIFFCWSLLWFTALVKYGAFDIEGMGLGKHCFLFYLGRKSGIGVRRGIGWDGSSGTPDFNRRK